MYHKDLYLCSHFGSNTFWLQLIFYFIQLMHCFFVIVTFFLQHSSALKIQQWSVYAHAPSTHLPCRAWVTWCQEQKWRNVNVRIVAHDGRGASSEFQWFLHKGHVLFVRCAKRCVCQSLQLQKNDLGLLMVDLKNALGSLRVDQRPPKKKYINEGITN